MIMAERPELENHVRTTRQQRNWSQDELSRRAGLSRAGVSAIENGRLVPSTTAALALAAAFGCRVEDLFRLPSPRPIGAPWAWPPPRPACRYWSATFADGVRHFPVEASPLGVVPHDGIFHDDAFFGSANAKPERTLILASCDPAVGLLAAELARTADVRLIVLSRSSRAALALLGQGLVHAAGVHLARTEQASGNAAIVRESLGSAYTLLRVAHWEEGVAFAPGRDHSSVASVVRSDLRWVGRETGSGARECLDELLDGRPTRHLASDHRGVAEAVRHGWADAGVCLRLVSEEAGLGFLGVRREVYDLCLPPGWKADDRLRALVSVVRSTTYRRHARRVAGLRRRRRG